MKDIKVISEQTRIELSDNREFTAPLMDLYFLMANTIRDNEGKPQIEIMTIVAEAVSEAYGTTITYGEAMYLLEILSQEVEDVKKNSTSTPE